MQDGETSYFLGKADYNPFRRSVKSASVVQ